MKCVDSSECGSSGGGSGDCGGHRNCWWTKKAFELFCIWCIPSHVSNHATTHRAMAIPWLRRHHARASCLATQPRRPRRPSRLETAA